MYLKSTSVSLIAECDGTGEPNIEPQVRDIYAFNEKFTFIVLGLCWTSFLSLQLRSLMQFMEWVDEGTKCPYCEGLGYNICDLCGGKTMV